MATALGSSAFDTELDRTTRREHFMHRVRAMARERAKRDAYSARARKEWNCNDWASTSIVGRGRGRGIERGRSIVGVVVVIVVVAIRIVTIG